VLYPSRLVVAFDLPLKRGQEVLKLKGLVEDGRGETAWGVTGSRGVVFDFGQLRGDAWRSFTGNLDWLNARLDWLAGQELAKGNCGSLGSAPDEQDG
jgi:hypothetical protein